MKRLRRARRSCLLVIAVAFGWAAAPAPAALVTTYPVPQSLKNVDRIAPGPDGALWFTQEEFQLQTSALGRITTAGVVSVVPVPAGSSAFGLTTGPDAALWYAGAGADSAKLGRVTPAGITETAVASDSANGIVTGPDQALWFTATDRIGRRAPDGTLSYFPVPGATSLERIVSAPDALWFSDALEPMIGRITPTGELRQFRLPAKLGADDIAVGSDGALWFTSFFTERIGRIGPSGHIRTFRLPYGPNSPDAITAGPDGALWYTSSLFVSRLTTTGEFTDITAPDNGDLLTFAEAITTGPDQAIWFTQQNVGEAIESVSAQVSKIDLPVVGKQLLVAKLADGQIRGQARRRLRISFTSTRRAAGVLKLSLNDHLAMRRKVAAQAGANTITVRLPRKPGTYRLLLTLNLPSQSGSDSALVTVTR